MLPQASSSAHSFEILFGVIFWFSLISFLAVSTAIVFFVIKFHRTRRDPFKTPFIHGHTVLETSVAVGLFVVVMIFFIWGWADYKKILNAPQDPLEINVIGKQWLWEMEYSNGRKLINEMVVPKDEPVKLLFSSADVIHSFFIPNFRLKQDVVPGLYTTLWFQASLLGEHPVLCAEYCGSAHSKMLATLKVVSKEDYDTWQKQWEKAKTQKVEEAQEDAASMAEQGKGLFTQKGCTACHTVTGQKLIGPPLNGIFGKEVELQDGSKHFRDENYIRESLMTPGAKMVKGFAPLMPTFQGTLSDSEVNAVIAYLKSLKE
ncbi:MAG: cytochrome c oxidase subunit II [Deltaproteobacteria bacterium]|nr:cytochrome c oxidase subunit II [Deltaproteobacteria bacterium]